MPQLDHNGHMLLVLCKAEQVGEDVIRFVCQRHGVLW